MLHAIIDEVVAGRTALIGAMIESNLEPGNQPFPVPREQLRHGVSITDACIGWAETEQAVRDTFARLAPRFAGV